MNKMGRNLFEWLNILNSRVITSRYTSWEEVPLGDLVAAILDTVYPERAAAEAVAEQVGKELIQLRKQIYTNTTQRISLDTFKQWKDVFNRLYFHNIDRQGWVEKTVFAKEADGRIVWDFYLEMLCEDIKLPSECWIDVENINGGSESILILNNSPQYKVEAPHREVVEAMATIFLRASLIKRR